MGKETEKQQPSTSATNNQPAVISYAKLAASSAIQFGTVPSPNTGEAPVVKIGTVPIMTTSPTGKTLPLPPRTHSAPPEAALTTPILPTAVNTQAKKEQPEKKSALPVDAAPYEPSIPFGANPMLMFGAPREAAAPVQAAPYFYASPKFGIPAPLVNPLPAALVAAAAVPILAQPPVKKPIRIRDPNTNEDISLVPVTKPAVILAAPAAASVAVESSPASSVGSSTGSVKRGISIVDPKSGKPVELTKLVPPTKNEEKTETSGPKLEESLSSLSLAEPEIVPLDIEEEEEEDDEEFSGLIRPGMKIFYPARFTPYEPPKTAQEIWRYARSFLLQFMTICTQKPDKAAEMARIAAHQQQTRGNRRGKPPKKVYSEAELQAYAQMLSRAENAWTPVADTSRLAEEERIIREVKGILNKLTTDKFDTLTKQVEDLGITSANVLSGVIDVIFEKATMEPKFAEMYAAFCIRIVQHEVNVLVKTNAQATAMDSLFRRMLIEKCQREYNNKRAWSEERMQLAAQGIHVKSIASGDLSDQDYEMIRKKRKVLGNIRFIGELFKVKLIGPRIMHACLTEMLTNVEEPEEEEVECVCRLFGTVNQMLENSSQMLKDETEKRDFIAKMVMYRERLGVLAKHSQLCTRVRFMVMDVLDAMKKQQQPTPAPVAAPPKSVTPSSTPQTSSKLHVKSRRPSEKTSEKVESDASGWNTATQRKSSDDGWSTSGSVSSERSSGRDRRSQTTSPQPSATKVFTTTNRKSTTPSPAPAIPTPERTSTPSSTNSMNRFDALEEQQVLSPPRTLLPPSPRIIVIGEEEEKRIKVFLSIYNVEYLSMKSIPALLEYFNEILSVEGKVKAVEQLVLQAMEKHSRFEQWREFFVPAGQQLLPLLPGDKLIALLKRVFASAVELSMDIPLMTEYCGALIALVLVPTGVEHVTPLLPWQEDELYSVKIFAAFLKFTSLSKVEVSDELLQVLKRHERVLEKTAEKVPRLEATFFQQHYESAAGNDLRMFFTKYPNAARKQLEPITRKLLNSEKAVDDLVSEFVMMVSPLLDDCMQAGDWQAMVRGLPEDAEIRKRIAELKLIPGEHFQNQF